MEQHNPYKELMFPPDNRIIDEDAFTVKEIAQYIGLAESRARNRANEKVEAGEWERVWKKIEKRWVPAYRPKRTS